MPISRSTQARPWFALCLALLAGQGLAQPAPTPRYQVDIQRTAYGIPHIQAGDFASLGYGVGYSYAQDNLCLLADQVVTVRGERSLYFGAQGSATVGFQQVNNLDSDVFFQAMMDVPALRRGYAQGSPDARSLMRGYAAGVNRFLRDTPAAARPAACRDAPWVRNITEADVMRLLEEKAIQASAGSFVTAIARTQPPAAPTGSVPPADLEAFNRQHRINDLPIGSNGWAFGAQASSNGRGLLLGNPHFPWTTTNRFYEMHLTVPGRLDVMGASLGGMPLVNIGFNRDVAWTHTVSTDKRFTLGVLTLVPGQPTQYLKDGQPQAMTTRTVNVRVRQGGVGPLRIERRTLHFTPDGPLVNLPQAGLNWTARTAFVLRDANRLNTRMVDTWLGFGEARSTGDIRAALDLQGIPWVNTIAADRAGLALYADISTSPNVSAAQQAACTPAPFAPLFAAAGLAVLDGSRSACDWAVDPASRVPGLRAPARQPVLVRQDYVQNSNDSAWMTNPRARIEGLDPIVGATNAPLGMRTRMGLREIGARLDGDGTQPGRPFDLAALQETLFADRNLSGLLMADDALRLCRDQPAVTLASGAAVDLGAACGVLGAWDRRSDLDSVGAVLWREFWNRARQIRGVYAVAFSPADPVGTPRGLNLGDAAVRGQLLQAMGEAAQTLRANGVALDAPLGTVQGVTRNGVRFPLHGAPDYEGVLNKIEPPALSPAGYEGVTGNSSSYIQTVTFGETGPVAQALLTYSQSTDPASAHYADQTALFSRKQWVTLPFTPAEIRADPATTALRLEE
ncbi:acylase [uncultured Deinococcus sp.]|uniref:acylase n=1 Tax=uncultured Deinococcus sp. TaxID=158789 RepID=UPI0025868794|nr:acylase [uncultured Deinococcus sp.]